MIRGTVGFADANGFSDISCSEQWIADRRPDTGAMMQAPLAAAQGQPSARLSGRREGGSRGVIVVTERHHWWHNTVMPVQITIRGVPEEVRDELAARAARQRQSMQEYLRGELARIASRPSVDAWLQGVRERKAVTGTRVDPDQILRACDADRP